MGNFKNLVEKTYLTIPYQLQPNYSLIHNTFTCLIS